MNFTENELWLKKAIAFVVRARQEFWGRNNAEILAFLFDYGLSNKTAEELILGWNKRNKFRSAESWGVGAETGKLFFPEGIVVPYVVEEKLKKIIIVRNRSNPEDERVHVVEGSQPVSMIFGERVSSGCETIVIDHILDGFYLLQEWAMTGKKEKLCLIIPHDLSKAPDLSAREQIEKAGKVLFLSRQNNNAYALWAKAFASSTLCCYRNRAGLLKLCRGEN